MNKITGFAFLIVLLSCTRPQPPQDSLTLTIQFKPEKKYTQTTNRSSLTTISYAGSEKSMQRLKAMGVKNPANSERNSQLQTVLKTGKSDDGSSFKVSLKVMKNSGKGNTEVPEGTVFHGRCFDSQMPGFDTVEPDRFNENHRIALIRAAQNTFTQLNFPQDKLKIGDHFSVQNPMEIPMEGSTVDIVVTTRYTLQEIKNGLARFDVRQEYAMNPKMLNNSFQGTGSGKGELVYDTKQTMMLRYQLNSELEIKKQLTSFQFDLKTRNTLLQTIDIEENNGIPE